MRWRERESERERERESERGVRGGEGIKDLFGDQGSQIETFVVRYPTEQNTGSCLFDLLVTKQTLHRFTKKDLQSC